MIKIWSSGIGLDFWIFLLGIGRFSKGSGFAFLSDAGFVFSKGTGLAFLLDPGFEFFKGLRL